ncbi:MAG: cupin [Verrucomicrobia bacterium]|nr:MAG: cupin [Verrucomicrobiota bacterium]
MASLRRPRRVPSAASPISSRFSKYRDMRKVNLKEIPERERKSPKGKFGRASKNISVALGREPESLDLSKRHPFDLALVRIPKGKLLCPYHSHSAESELYLVVSGRGSIRDKDGITEVGPGDAFFFQPGEAHQIANAGSEDFVYYVIADNPRSGGATGDSCYYPDSGKWAVGKEENEEVMVKGTETD